MIEALRTRGVEIAEITLHVGYGTFQPVRVDDVADPAESLADRLMRASGLDPERDIRRARLSAAESANAARSAATARRSRRATTSAKANGRFAT